QMRKHDRSLVNACQNSIVLCHDTTHNAACGRSFTLVLMGGRRLESTLRLLTLQDKRGFCTSMLFEQAREPSNQLMKPTPKTFASRLADLCTERPKEKL